MRCDQAHNLPQLQGLFAFRPDQHPMLVAGKPEFHIGYLIAGMLGLGFGAEWAIQGGVGIGQLVGLSDRVIGIAIISVGTGLPDFHRVCKFQPVIGLFQQSFLNLPEIGVQFL